MGFNTGETWASPQEGSFENILNVSAKFLSYQPAVYSSTLSTCF